MYDKLDSVRVKTNISEMFTDYNLLLGWEDDVKEDTQVNIEIIRLINDLLESKRDEFVDHINFLRNVVILPNSDSLVENDKFIYYMKYLKSNLKYPISEYSITPKELIEEIKDEILDINELDLKKLYL